MGRAKERGGVLLLVGVGLPFPSPTRKRRGEEKRGRGRGKGGCAPPLLVQLGLLWEGAHHLLAAALSLPSRPTKAQYFPEGFR